MLPIVLDGITQIAILILVALGLQLILGLQGVINFAHVGFLAVGAYGALVASRLGINPWFGALVGAAAAGILGALAEVTIIRRLYHRPLDTILATWGLSLVIWQVLTVIFTDRSYPYTGPAQGIFTLGIFAYSRYRLLLLGIAVVLIAALWFSSRYTTIGLVARAVMANEDLAESVGLDTTGLRRVTFTLGCALAGLAGGLLAAISPVAPFFGFGYLIPAFLAVLLAGRSVTGLVAAVAILSGGQTLAAVFVNSIVAQIIVVVLAVAMLRLLPNGLEGLRRFG